MPSINDLIFREKYMSVKVRIQKHLKENRWHYLLLGIVFVLGLFLGYYKVFSLENEVRDHLLALINNYLLGGFRGELSSAHIFSSAYLQQFKSLFLIWFLGLTVIGIPLIIGVVFFRGFSLGFTIGFLVKEKAGAGIIISFLSIFPQNIVYIPLIIAWALIAINFSVYIVRGRDAGGLPLTAGLVRYFLLLLACLLLVLVGVLIETYLPPWLLGLFL